MKKYIGGALLLQGWLLMLGAAGGMDCGTLSFGAAALAAAVGLGMMAATIFLVGGGIDGKHYR